MCCSEKCQTMIPFCLHRTMETPTSPIVQGCEPWDFNNIERSKGNCNGTNESKGHVATRLQQFALGRGV